MPKKWFKKISVYSVKLVTEYPNQELRQCKSKMSIVKVSLSFKLIIVMATPLW